MIKDDILVFETADGKKEEVELILTVDTKEKMYLLYRNKDNEVYASYILNNKNENILHNDLTEEEYKMLEEIYSKEISDDK